MGITVKDARDVVAFLEDQHRTIELLLERVATLQGTARAEAFTTLRKTLAVHEAAEEVIVHPVARRALPDGDAVVALRLEEEKRAKKALTALEALDAGTPEFDVMFRNLLTDVIAHAQAEERDEFTRLENRLDARQLERMRKAAELAEAVAPTRPHAGVESAIANLLVGPFAAMIDRTRDALSAGP